MTGPTEANRRHVLKRDKYRCLHCGMTEPLVIHHRINRGMGGSSALNNLSNLLTVCHWLNDKMESDPGIAEYARERGWKLSRYTKPSFHPIYDGVENLWFNLTDDGRRIPLPRNP